MGCDSSFPSCLPTTPPPPPPFLHFFVSVKTVKDAWLLGLSRRNDRPTTALSGWPGAAGEQYYFNLTPHFNLLKSRKDILLSISSNKNVKFKRTDRVVFRRHLTFPSVLQWLRLHHLFKCNASVQLGAKDERSFEETGLETTNAWNRTESIQKMNYALCLWLSNYSTCLKVSDIQCDTFCFLSDWLRWLDRLSCSGSIPPKFEHKLRRHYQRFGKITTTGLQWHRSCHSKEMGAISYFTCRRIFLGTGNCPSKFVHGNVFLHSLLDVREV